MKKKKKKKQNKTILKNHANLSAQIRSTRNTRPIWKVRERGYSFTNKN
jgi:hypothetical protein